jgi:ferric-dicitrate binding protein FerR (iron transport regulator)
MDSFEHFTGIIHRYLEGTAEREELISLLEWLKKKSENITYFNQLCNIWEKSSETIGNKLGTEIALLKLNKRIKEYENSAKSETIYLNRSEAGMWRLRFVAAVFIGIITCSILTYYVFRGHSAIKNLHISYVEAIVPPSQKSQLILSDGTKVWLNSGTKFKYSTNYGLQTREVYLEGEAYFQVAKNPAKPFLVHASSIIVKALGTSFNVKCYASDKTIETTLVEGRIQVVKSGQGSVKTEPLLLNPNEKAVFIKNSQEIFITRYESIKTLEKVKGKSPVAKVIVSKTVQSDISWIEQQLVFENETLDDLAKRLERWYNINIKITDDKLKANRYTGKFVNNESIEQVLKIIAITTPIHYSIKDDNIIIDTKQK